ncbi:hypothetical protein KIL84_001001 [Mauremys mutica]|uniref:Uncharacterized protein n=1 Tax=Mauremys mutica TaxID=74926 RepID=A0A9D3WYA8_9SAUR|nr:hypothetical protein KIL84_001001 [Mauremys mutica]
MIIQKLYYHVKASPRTCGVGSEPNALNFCNGPCWLADCIIAHMGTLSCWVTQLPNVRHIHRYHKQIHLQYHEELPIEASYSDLEVPGIMESLNYPTATSRNSEIGEDPMPMTTADLEVKPAEMIVLSENLSAPAMDQGPWVFPWHHSRRSPKPRDRLDW